MMLEILIVGWTCVAFAIGWFFGRHGRRRLSTEQWIDAYLLGTGEGAAELVTQLLAEDRPGVRLDPSHRDK